MHVVVVGASGNLGTGVLRALAAEDSVTSVLGLARRTPALDTPPYDSASWASLDLTGPDVDRQLTEAFTGADAVIHLAWQIQPNRQRGRLREVNVEGTRRVAHAVARAGVPHLVVASSWAAYSPAEGSEPRGEDWHTGGVPSSHYSVDKAAQERVLDAFEREHPDIAVARLRTALVFQRDAGAEITRYFVGPMVPRSLLRPGTLPVLPWPAGVQVQVVHADDAGRAYAQIVREGTKGAFNVAAPPILTGTDVATILGRGRVMELPKQLMRTGLALAYDARVVPLDPGWLDMATSLPMMDTTRITDLGWAPQQDAAQTLREMIQGLYARAGTPVAVMQPDESNYQRVADHDLSRSEAAEQHRPAPKVPGPLRVPEHIDTGLLGLYLADHLTGATAGMSRVGAMAAAYADSDFAEDLHQLQQEITAEREFLRELIGSLGLHRRPARQGLAWIAEHLGRLKLNRRVVQSSPMTPLLELELMRSAVAGKQGGWQVLAQYGPDLGVPEHIATDLIERADHQMRTLERLHQAAREGALDAG